MLRSSIADRFTDVMDPRVAAAVPAAVERALALIAGIGAAAAA
jgi:hypothetical protein